MKLSHNKLIVLLLFVLILSGTNSYGMQKVAQSKMQFLKLGVGARAAAMGDAFTAQRGDLNSVFYNPAGSAYISGLGVAINQTNWIADINHQSAAIAYNTGRFGVVNLNYITMDYGTLERTVVDAHAWEGYISQGDFSVSEYALGFGYAAGITDRFSIGAQVKYVYENLGSNQIWRYIGSDFETTKMMENEDDVVAYDFGTFYDTGFKGLRLGMSVQNFANKAIPLNFRFGVSMDINELLFPGDENHILSIACDALHPRDYSEHVHLGMEYTYNQLLFLRAGYKFNYDEENLTAGAGVNLNLIGVAASFDYAYTNFGILGNVNRFSLNFHI